MEIKKEQLAQKIYNMKKKSDNLQCLVDSRFDEYRYADEANATIPVEVDEKVVVDDNSMRIKKLNKFKYAPGGSTMREEYQPKIPAISTCLYCGPLNLLVISFVDCETKFFRIQGMNERNMLDV